MIGFCALKGTETRRELMGFRRESMGFETARKRCTQN